MWVKFFKMVIVLSVRSSNRLRLNDSVAECKNRWSKVRHYCKDVSCDICADYCRPSRASLRVAVTKNSGKQDNPNNKKFQAVVDRILRTY